MRVQVGQWRWLLLFLLLAMWIGVESPARGKHDDSDPTKPAALLPDDTLLYLDVPAPERLVQKLLQHPTVAAVLELDAVKPNLRGPQFMAFKAGLALVEASLGAEWPALVADLSGNGIVVAALPGENRFVAILQARDEGRLKKAAESLLNLSAMEARNQGGQPPWRIEERGTAKIAIFDGFAMVRSGTLLALATRVDDAEAVLKRMSGTDRADTLAASSAFQASLQNAKRDDDSPDAVLWVNLEKIRAAGVAPALTQAVSDNPAAELVFGGVLATLGTNAAATTTLHLSDSALRLEATTDYRLDQVQGPREYWFGVDGRSEAPAWIPANSDLGPTAMQLSSYRDLGQWWLNKELLFTDSVVADLVQADSQLSTVFGGLDFGGEVLGAFEPGVQILVSGQPGSNVANASEQNQGSLQIPGFAIVGQLREPRQMTRRFKVAFQSVMGFVNLGLAQGGLPQYDVDTQTIEGGCECLSRIWVEDEADLESPVYSFSPSLIIKDGRFVLGSDAAWVRRLSDSPSPAAKVATGSDSDEPDSKTSEAHESRHINTSLRLDWQVVVGLLRMNRDTLVAQNMIENGNSRTTAGKEVDQLLQGLELISRVDFKIETDPEQMRLIGQIDLAQPQAKTPSEEQR
ncbi:MAG: hypothetical protein Q8M16_16830 [Pirellulaceae bacterium]|nr:hypothetical protein [Pirellulaceae bacterium]